MNTMTDPNSSHHQSSSSSTTGVFGWVAAITANLAFIALISYGAVKIWPVGCVLCLLYSWLLFALARRLDVVPILEVAPEGGDDVASTTETIPIQSQQQQQSDEDDVQATHQHQHQKKTPIIVSLLYGLAVVALAVAGGFPAMNLFSCLDTYRDENRGHWDTDAGALPRPVQKWARTGSDYTDDGADFLYLPSSEVTLFSGSNHSDGGYSIVWSVSPASTDSAPAPVGHPEYIRPTSFSLVTPTTGCFVTGQRDDSVIPNPFPRSKRQMIVCSDGTHFQETKTPSGNDQREGDRVAPYSLLPSEGLLWYKSSPNNGARGLKVYSLDPTTMNSTLYSAYTPPKRREPPTCNDEVSTRRKSVLALFLSAIPMAAVSIHLWMARSVPSMAVTTLVSVTFIYICIYVILFPVNMEQEIFIRVWLSLGVGALWTIILSRLLLLENDRIVQKAPLVWGINAGGLCFFFGMMALMGMFDYQAKGELLRYMALTVFCYMPLIVFGIGTNCVLLLVLGACGLLLDIGRFGMYLSDHVGGDAAFLVNFVVLAVGAICIGALGYSLNKRQDAIQKILKFLLASLWPPQMSTMSTRSEAGPGQATDPTNTAAMEPLLGDSEEGGETTPGPQQTQV